MAESDKQEVWYQGKAFEYSHLGGAEDVQDFHGPKAAEAAYDWFAATKGSAPFDSAYVYERQGDRETMIYHWAEGYDDSYTSDEEPLADWDQAAADCGMTNDGFCEDAGTEQCEFDCPFRAMELLS